MVRLRRDENYVTMLGAESSTGDGTIVPLYANPSTHQLLATVSATPAVYTTIVDDRKTVTNAGTRVPLVAISTACSDLVITALETNTDTVVVGGVTVVAAVATRKGIPLVASQSLEINISDVATVYIDSVVNGEGVSFSYLN